MELKININESLSHKLEGNAKLEKKNLNSYILEQLENLASSVYLINNYYFSAADNCLYHHSTVYREISLTRIEKKLLLLLIHNSYRVVHIDEIIKYIWNGRSVGIHSLRNTVAKIRIKTCYELIENYSSKGYRISLK